MRRTTIYAIAAGAAVSCFALVAPPACGGDANLGAGALPAADDEAPPLVAPQPASDFSPADGDAPPEFVWSSDVAIAPPPPPYLAHGPSAHLAPPSATATAIPLPPAAWTGFASLAGLGTIALVRRLRRRAR